MTVSTSVPATIQMRRSRLFGVIAAVAVAVGGITMALLIFAADMGTESAQKSAQPTASALSSLSPTERQYVQTIVSMSPAQLRAAFGTGGADSIDALGLSCASEKYVRAIVSMTPAQLRAAFGTSGVDESQRFVRAITSMTPAQLKAAFGTGLPSAGK